MLESIKGLGDILPNVNQLASRCGDIVGQLDGLHQRLAGSLRDMKDARDRDEIVKANQEKYADYKAKLDAEKKAAEDRVDARTEKKLAVAPTATKPAVANAPKGAEVRGNAPTREGFNRPTYTPQAGQGFRPQYQPGSSRPNPSYGNQATPARPTSWSSGTGTSRTFTPRDNNQPRPPYGQRPPYGNGQFPPRDGTRPPFQRPANGAPRPPFAPRPAGAPGARPLGGIKPTERFVPKADTSFSAKQKRVKSFENTEKSAMDKRTLLRRGILEEQEIEERMLTRIFKTKKSKENSSKPHEVSNIVVINTNNLTVKTLSEKIGKPVTEIIKQLMVLGNMSTINSPIDFDTASLVAGEFGMELQHNVAQTHEERLTDIHRVDNEDSDKLEWRPPVVTVMGHVDHGKTSLLDYIRNTTVQAKEHGGITQHIGAYMVKHGDRKITFIDTPGHAAFEKMRARGAKITDIAILIVAGDDGVMPQTIEAIKHIQKNKLPMIVACNKMDKKEANIERVKEQLAAHNVLTEEWGGDAILVPISAQTGMGIDKLLEMILLVAEMNGYRANPHKAASGAIIEAHRDAAMGVIATVLVQNGTMKVGDTLLAGTESGKVRKMTDENGKTIKNATPGMPVRVLGFGDVPKAGDMCYVVDDKLTKQVVSERKDKEKAIKVKASTKVASDIDAIAHLDESAKKQLNLIIKSDVSGSLEAILQSVATIQSDEVRVSVISSGVGAVNDNDVARAHVTGAKIIAFNVKATATATQMAKKEKIVVNSFNVIYQIFDFVTEQMVRLFTPKFNEVYYGKAEVRALFKSSVIGMISGCMVIDGRIVRDTEVKVIRGDKNLGTFKLESLKIKKDDVKEVAKGFECGIKLGIETMEGDIIECYGKEQQPVMYNGRKYEF